MLMIDVGEKDITLREAVVSGEVILSENIVEKIRNNGIKKGNVMETAKTAGIMAAKNTSNVIPLCHPIVIDFVDMEIDLGKDRVKVTSIVRGEAKTGVEMEAFNAVSAACLTVYDMCKYLCREAVISDIKLIKKSGGKNGDYERQ